MASQKRNLTQEFETLLNGRSILDLTGEVAVKSTDLLTEIAKSKPLKSLTKVELQALVEELSEILSVNMFKGDLPEDWKKQALDLVENCNEKELNLSFVSIFDFYHYSQEVSIFHKIEMNCDIIIL